MRTPIEVCEYDAIISNSMYNGDNRYTCIKKTDFDDLMRFIREYEASDDEADALEFMKIGYRRSIGDMITIRNYVGLIQLRSGFQLQVLPKIYHKGDDDRDSAKIKEIFIKMLRSMKDFPGRAFNTASLRINRMNLYELFINMYLQQVCQLIKNGIRSSYVTIEDNLRFFKGKILIGSHIIANYSHKERFYVSYDEFHPNCPENRLVKSTLMKLHNLTSSAENAKEIRQLLSAFEMVEPSLNYEKDFLAVVINRNTKDYDLLMKWSRVFLLNKSFTPFSGNTMARTLLFPMESVYESYVASQIKRYFVPDGWSVSCQERKYHLFETPRKQFALSPDIVMRRDGRTIVFDTKWKNLISNEQKNYGISQADMYQMYAYSKKYDAVEVWLLYPENKEMHNHFPIVYDSDDDIQRTRVGIFCVDLDNIEYSMLKLKQQIITDVFIVQEKNI